MPLLPIEHAFLDDMNHAVAMDEQTNSYGCLIDELVESAKENVGLFESKEEKEWRENLGVRPAAFVDGDIESIMDDMEYTDSLFED